MTDSYAAGILDGEGSVGIFNQAGYYSVRVKVGMSDKGYAVLRLLEREYGGATSSPRLASGNARASREWRLSGPNAVSFLRRVHPFLRIKRTQAELAFQLSDLVSEAPKRPNGRKEWSDKMRAQAEVLKRRMNEENQRGTAAAFQRQPAAGALAVLHYGEWMEPEPDLFGPVPYVATLPTNGSMRSGSIFSA